MQSRNKTKDLDDVVHLLENLKKGSMYNNLLIQKLLSNAKLAPYFRDFLEHHAK